MGLLCKYLVGALPCAHYVIYHPPSAEIRIPRHKNDLTRPPGVVTAKTKQEKNNTYPGCLAHAVKGVCFSVVANRRQPGRGGGEGVLDNMHGRSCMTIDPRISTRGWR